VRNALCVLSGIFNYAVDDEILESNPTVGLGKFTRSAAKTTFAAVALTREEARVFLDKSKEIAPEYFPIFAVGLRAGLRRGELVALRWGDVQFGKDENDPNRYILVQHNFVLREHTNTKSKKTRRVDMSRQLRSILLEHREKALLKAFMDGKATIADDLVCPSPEGSVLDPDNLYKRYFLPVPEASGLRKFRLHDLRHTFGSLLIQDGASLKYVCEQMGHSSIKVTADTYGHLIPGADISWVDRLDSETSQQQNATPAQPAEKDGEEIPSKAVDLFGGGGWTRTNDLRIMRPSL